MGAKFCASGIEAFSAIALEVRERIARVSLLVLDVDGVLTDGGLYYTADGSVTKRFNVQDGLGIGLARQNGVRVAVITGQDTPSVAARMRDLHIDDYFPGYTDKYAHYETVRQKYGLGPEEVAFLGDDWVDLTVMRAVGVPLAVANAQPEVKDAALYVTAASGGNGAVREAVRCILYCRGQLDLSFNAWMKRYTS